MMFRVYRRHRAVAHCCCHLSYRIRPDIAGGKNARHAGLHFLIGDYGAVFRQVDDVFQVTCIWPEASSDKDAVRFLIGDTDSCDQQLQDNEIEYALTQGGNVNAAALICCESLIAKYTRMVDETVGAVSFRLSTRAEQYKQLADTLRRKQSIRSGLAYAGGISKSDKSEDESNTDLVRPDFIRDLHSDPEVNLKPTNNDDDEY